MTDKYKAALCPHKIDLNAFNCEQCHPVSSTKPQPTRKETANMANVVLNEAKRAELRSLAEGRMKSFGTGAIIKMQAKELLACLDFVDGIEQQALSQIANAAKVKETAKAERAEAGDMAADAVEAASRANRATADAEKSQTELALIRKVVAAAEATGRKKLPAALKEYRAIYPEAAVDEEPETPAPDAATGESAAPAETGSVEIEDGGEGSKPFEDGGDEDFDASVEKSSEGSE